MIEELLRSHPSSSSLSRHFKHTDTDYVDNF